MQYPYLATVANPVDPEGPPLLVAVIRPADVYATAGDAASMEEAVPLIIGGAPFLRLKVPADVDPLDDPYAGDTLRSLRDDLAAALDYVAELRSGLLARLAFLEHCAAHSPSLNKTATELVLTNEWPAPWWEADPIDLPASYEVGRIGNTAERRRIEPRPLNAPWLRDGHPAVPTAADRAEGWMTAEEVERAAPGFTGDPLAGVDEGAAFLPGHVHQDDEAYE